MPSLHTVYPDHNAYVPKLKVYPNGTWELVSRPTYPRLYRSPIWKRVLFLDGKQLLFPTWRVRSEEPNMVSFRYHDGETRWHDMTFPDPG
ncbi:MAG: hypothetical protein JXQ73_26785 [Phycisphaerae bacterium]|nr:hypothetical protein [Phycisphaerae bacterium]